jgi:SAM-dependent methyltransferase
MGFKKLRWWRTWVDEFSAVEKTLSGKRILEIGAGRSRRNGVKTMDVNPVVSPDFLHDLNKIPWPISDKSFDAVYAFSVLEHVDAPLDVLCEIHRILAPGGVVCILVPHFSSHASYDDPTHRVHLSSRSFDYLIEGTELEKQYGFYRSARFQLRSRLVSLEGFWNWLPFLARLVNRWNVGWERYLSFVIRGSGIYIELTKNDN